VDSAKLEQGEYTGTIQVESDSQPLSLPFDLRVSSVRMGKPRLSLGMWDGSQDGRYGPNTAQAIRLMNSHLVDSPWSNLDVLPWPDDSYFDASDKLTRPLSFKALDAWVAQRPGARHYFVFANVGDEFTGIKAGTPRFNARVASWAAAVAEHMRSLKLNPEQLGLLLIDEPANAEQTQRMVHWAAAIRAASPRVAIFQDMDIVHGSETSEYSKLLLQAATLSDIFCPQLIVYNAGGDAAATYFRNLQQEDRQLWFYQCMGPPKSYGPQIYYRLAAWHAFVRDARGLGFWAFSDEGNARSSWNEYETSRMPYSPVFLDPKGITNSIHWDAVREGIEDHEYLSMLQDAIGQATDAKLKSDAQSLLNASGNALLKTYPVESADYAWIKSDANPFQPDGYRVRVLRLLEKLQTN